MSTEIQALLFDQKHWTTDTARKWMQDHNYDPIKRVHKTTKYLRYRLKEPSNRKLYRFITFSEKDHIDAILEVKKPMNKK